MATPTEEIAIQNENYRQSLLTDIQKRNDNVVRLMDETVKYKNEKQSSNRLEAMNSFSPEQRRRLMSGEKLENILGMQMENESRYYNTSDEAAQYIPQDDLFVYQIGDHLMAYETKDVKINKELKTIDLPVVVHTENEEWVEMYYTIHNADVFDILQHQLDGPKTSSGEGNVSDSDHLPFMIEEEWDHPVLPDSPISPRVPNEKEHYNIVRRIQDKLYEQLLSIYQGESVYLSEVYTPQMEIRISEMLNTHKLFPFQIVNNLISEFTE